MLQGKIKIHKEETKPTYLPPTTPPTPITPFITAERRKTYDDALIEARQEGFLPGKFVTIKSSQTTGRISYLENNIHLVKWTKDLPEIIRVTGIGPNNYSDTYHHSELALITSETTK